MAREVGSPLSAAWVAGRKSSIDELSSADGKLWWVQSDPDQGGVSRLMRWTAEEGVRAVTSPDLPVGGWLHAYGGGCYAVGPECVWIVGGNDSSIYRLDHRTEPVLAVRSGDGFVYGDLHTADGKLLAVRERGDVGGDEIVEVHPDCTATVLVSSPGFLAAPRLSNGRLAYVAWDADEMPWDASRLYTTAYDTGIRELVAGGETESVVQPTWGPDGALYFLTDRSGWWNLYRFDGDAVQAVAPIEQDCAPAPWEGGYQSHLILPDGRIALIAQDGFGSQLLINGPDGRWSNASTRLTSIKPHIAVVDAGLAVIGSTPEDTPAVLIVNPAEPDSVPNLIAGASESRRTEVVLSPQDLRWLQYGSSRIGYLLTVPASRSDPVPLLVRAHPGPTDGVPYRLDWTAQFFASHGFAVADVAYRGSSGQGRVFRQELGGHWGEYDVQDCTAVAEHLLAEGLAQRGAVFITGASAGGYTALQAVSRPGPFTGATAVSAIIDPVGWTQTAPRFQRPHAAHLAGPAGAVQADRVGAPVLIIHGTADTIAPVEDAKALAKQLTDRGAHHASLFLDGVGHYLSDPASLEAALESELAFYCGLIAERDLLIPGGPPAVQHERTR